MAAPVDALAPAAAALRSVNTVVRRATDGRSTGHSTDGDGFVEALAARGVDVAGRHVAVLGAGAAARSVVEALGRAGAASIVVVNRTRGDGPTTVVGLAAVARPAIDIGVDDDRRPNSIVNATSVGFGADETCRSTPPLLHRDHVVADLVYHPLETPLLAGRPRGRCPHFDGLGMLVHQAALQQHAVDRPRRPTSA